MRFILLSCALLLSCADPAPTTLPVPLVPAPRASLQAPKLALHPGWNPLLKGDLPTLKFSKKLSLTSWDSARAWRTEDFLVIWAGSSAKDNLGLIVDTRTGEWRYINTENAPPLHSWGMDGDRLIPPPPPPPPLPPRRYEHGGTFSINGRIIFFGINWWWTNMSIIFDPALNQWIPIDTNGMPSVDNAIIIPTDDELIVWTKDNNGARFDPIQNRWRPMSQTNAPNTMPRFSLDPRPELLVDGDLIIWDGEQGAVYHLASDSWTPMSTEGAPKSSELVRVNNKFFASDRKKAAFFDPKTNQWSSAKKPKGPKSCGCGSFRNPFQFEDGKLSYENEDVPSGWLEYNEDKNKWSPKKEQPEVKKPELIKDTASYYNELSLWVYGDDRIDPPRVALEFYGVAEKQVFEELVLSQLWLYLPE